jgi:hypothetical protein
MSAARSTVSRGIWLVVAMLCAAVLQPVRAARDYYVSADGAPHNRGTADSPWDLRTALAGGNGDIRAGDSVYLLNGTYRGHFTVDVSGNAGSPIVFKAFRNANPVLDGNVTTVTTSSVRAGRPGDEIVVTLESALDVRPGMQIVLGGGSGHDQIFFVSSVLGGTVTGTRRCVLDSQCIELPKGSVVWVLLSVLHIPPTVHDVWFHGLEVTDSGTDSRVWATSGDDDFLNVAQRRQNGIFNYGTRTRIIDCVVHDVVNGIGAWTQAVDSEYSGVIAFNNGMFAPDRGHGHGFYIQNELNGSKTFRQVVSMQNFGLLSQMYVSRADLTQGNVLFDSTVWVAADPGLSPPVNQAFLLGGAAPIRNATIRNSHFFGRPLQIGYGSPNNDNILLTNNIFRSGVALSLSRHVTLTGNIFANLPANGATSVGIRLETGNVPADYSFSNNVYIRSNLEWPHHQFYVVPINDANCGYYWFSTSADGYGYCPTPQSWQDTLGYDKSGSTFMTSSPSGANVVVLADPYDAHRYLLIVHNWDQAPTVQLNVAGLRWPNGARYALRNVADYYGDVVRGIYRGSAEIPIAMTGHSISTPTGFTTPLAVSTFPDFGVFVLTVDDPS